MPASRIKRNIVRRIKDEDVYDLLRKIPSGKVSTYGDLAKALGNPSASRVIVSDGKVGGYAYGTARKKDLLEKEGVFITNGIIKDFKNVRVHP